MRVTLSDSGGVRIPDAELTILRGLRDTVAVGKTSERGEWSTLLSRSASPYQLVIRKIGYNRLQRFFMATNVATDLTLRVGRVAQALAQVKITEKEDAVRKSYFIDADDIANSPRPLVDASDILMKLRPDMIYSRGGRDACESISNIWVNGVAVYREFTPVAAPRMSSPSRRPALPASPIAQPPYPISEMARDRVKSNPNAAAIGAARLTLLEGIKPEHIEQITYKDCYDTSMRGNFTKNALFIVLKPGIRYERGIGTYALEGGRTAR